MLDLTHVRSFVTLAEEMHFGRAAARLNLTQSPLSRQMQMLEHRLGVALLERTTRIVRLTPVGTAFLQEARELLAVAAAAERTARRVAGGESGPVRIGFTAASAFEALPRLVAEIGRLLPGLDLVLEEMVTGEQMAALAARRLDLGLVRPTGRGGADANVASELLLREGLLLAMPARHPLAAGRQARWRDLDGQPLVSWAPGGGDYFLQLLERAFRHADVRPRIVQRVNQTHTILALVAAGLGLALVPEAARRMRVTGIVLRPIPVPQDARPELALAWRHGELHPAVARIRSLAKELFRP